MKLASGTAPVVDMLKRGIAVGLGTDGPAGSNNDFDLMEEMDLAAKLQKLIRNDPQALPAKQAFEMATIGGARVLGMEKEIGSLETGKRADLISIDLDRAQCRADVRRLFAAGLFAKGIERGRRGGERSGGCAG